MQGHGHSIRVESKRLQVFPFYAKGFIQNSEVGIRAEPEVVLPLRDSAGFSPDFPHFSAMPRQHRPLSISIFSCVKHNI
jgi:hypothetical protein